MAFASVGTLVNAQNRTGSTNVTFNFAASRSVGNLFIVVTTIDNTGSTNGQYSANEIGGLSDSVGNVYTKLTEWSYGTGSGATGTTTSIHYTICTNAVTTANTITATFSGSTVTAKAMVGWAFSMGSNNRIWMPTPVVVNSPTANATVSIAGYSGRERILMRVHASEATGVLTLTPTSGWTSAGANGTSGGGSGLNVTTAWEFKIGTFTASETSSSTYASGDSVNIGISLVELPKRRVLSIT